MTLAPDRNQQKVKAGGAEKWLDTGVAKIPSLMTLSLSKGLRGSLHTVGLRCTFSAGSYILFVLKHFQCHIPPATLMPCSSVPFTVMLPGTQTISPLVTGVSQYRTTAAWHVHF